jgi:ATP-dependent protease ClpP protease subunit
MSSIVLQAADQRIMAPNSYFMCHFGSIACNGNYLDIHNAIVQEKKATDIMLDIYVQSAMRGKYFKETMIKPSEQKIRNFIKKKMKNGDWYLSADETVYYGFADGVLSSRKFKDIDAIKYDE